MSTRIIIDKELKAMPVLDVKDEASLKAHLKNDPKNLYSKEELESIHRAIRYTQQYKQQESYDKMDIEEMMARPVPKISKSLLKELGKG